MRKLVYMLLGALFVPVIILITLVVIPLFLLFLVVLKIFTFRIRMKPPRRQSATSRKIHQPDDVVDIQCEVMDDKDGK